MQRLPRMRFSVHRFSYASLTGCSVNACLYYGTIGRDRACTTRTRREKSWTRPVARFSIDYLALYRLPTIGLTVTKRSLERINLSSTLPRTIDRERTLYESHAHCQKDVHVLLR